jgi:DNA-binding Lrp family transcriptional regulator
MVEANLTDLEIKLLTLLKAEPRISASAIASKLEIKRDTVKEYLQRLKGKGFLVREGTPRSGRWIVADPNFMG